MATSNPTLYASSFGSSRSPPSTFHPISLRLSLHRALTHDLAGYVRERAAIEDAYVKSLERLASRLHSGPSAKETVFSELDAFNLDPLQTKLQLGTSLTQVQKTLELEVLELARIHKGWKDKIVQQVETPLEHSVNKGEWSRWTQEETRLRGDVKEYESLVDKVSKQQTKASKSSSKLLSTQSSLSSLGSSLTGSLPSFLTQSQALELAHVQLVKQALTQFGTFGADLARERMELGERLVETVLGVDEGLDAQEWALREGAKASAGGTPAARGEMGEFGQQTREREDSAADTDSLAASVTPAATRGDQLYPTSTTNNNQRERTTSRLSTAPPVAPLPLPTTANDDAQSINSTSNAQTPSKTKSKLGSKLSSLLGGGKKDKDKDKQRDRSSSIPNSARYSTFAPTNDAPPVPSSPSIRSGGGMPPPMERNQSNRSNGSDLLGGTAGGEGNGSFQAPLQPVPASDNSKRNSMFPSLSSNSSNNAGGGGGGMFRRQSRMNSIPDDYVQPSAPSVKNERRQGQGYGDGVPFVAEPSSIGAGGVDSDGFSVPPKGYDRAIGETTGSRNLMDDDDDDDDLNDRRPLGEKCVRISRSTGPALDSFRPSFANSVPKLNILPVSLGSPSIPPSSPVISQESEQERLAALSAIKNSLGAPPSSSSSVAGGLNRRTTARGRRSEASVPPPGSANRSSMLPSASPAVAGLSAAAGAGAVGAATVGVLERRETDDDVPLATIQQESRRKAPPPPSSASASSPTSLTSPTSPIASNVPIASSVNNPSRAMSILSTNSSIVTAGGGSSALRRADPFEGATTPGLRISIVEQVNVLMKNGEVQKVLVTGEIGVSYRPEDAGDESSPLTLRLSDHEQLEKTAPNSTYLAPATANGEFTLSRASLAAKGGQTVPVLKYQVKQASASARDLVPVFVKPTWRCEPTLTRIIVVYSHNPSFSIASSPASSPFGDDDGTDENALELSDLTLEVPFAPGQVSSFQSKPGAIGAHSPSNSGALTFQLPAPPSGGRDEAKLLVSAQTETAARVGNMNLKWRIAGQTIARVRVEVVGSARVAEVKREVESGKYIIA
ncbi:hypothetical protein JCM11491_004201 [Sporobolomyces phaffii]